jgi:hypothetical protein
VPAELHGLRVLRRVPHLRRVPVCPARLRAARLRRVKAVPLPGRRVPLPALEHRE